MAEAFDRLNQAAIQVDDEEGDKIKKSTNYQTHFFGNYFF
jgi:hypothetical protein